MRRRLAALLDYIDYLLTGEASGPARPPCEARLHHYGRPTSPRQH